MLAGALGLTAVAAPAAAFAVPSDPTAPTSTDIHTTLPTGLNPDGRNLNIIGSFSGLRPGESTADYDMWVSCDDLNTYNVKLTDVPSLIYPDGTRGGQLAVSIPALEQGHECRIQTGGVGGRRLAFAATGWTQFLGAWTLDLTGHTISVSKTGGL